MSILAAMSNKSKAKGTRAESRVVKYLLDHGIEAKRKALAGKDDEGDIELPKHDLILEVKTGKMTDKYSRSQLDEWIRQSIVEGDNSNSCGLLVIVRYNRAMKDAEVWEWDPFSESREMVYLDEFVRYLSDEY